MGTENSKPEKHTTSARNLNKDHIDMAIKQALEQQQKMYEEKLDKLVKSQLQSKTAVPHSLNQNSARNLNNGHIDMAIKQALEQQRKMYKEKLEKLVKSQLQSKTAVPHNLNQNSARNLNNGHTDMAIKEALEQQRKMYEEKLDKLVKSQSQSKTAVPHNLNQNSARNLNNGHTDTAIKEALEQQRKMYEEKLDKLVKSQSQSKTAVPHNLNQNSITPNMQQNPSSSSIGPLYPNLNVMTNTISNRHTVHHDQDHPSVLNTYEFKFSPAVPSAPVESVNDVDVTSKKNTNKGAIPKSRTSNYQKKKTNDNQSVNCVTCSGTLGLQIYQCNSGHSSCSQCRLFNKHCGICSKSITDMRNITLEAFIADLQINNNDDVSVKCPNTKDGCCLSFKKVAMEEHIKECPYKDLECPLLEVFGICKWRGKINHLLQHFKDVHPEHCFADVDKEMKILDTGTEFHNVYFVNIGSFNFLIHIKQDSHKTLYMTAAMFGTKFSASKWSCEFHVYNKKEPRRKFTYIDICNSFVTPVKELFELGQCAVLDQQYAKTFFNNNELNYKFYMKKNVDSKKIIH